VLQLRNANIYEEPNKHSKLLKPVTPITNGGKTILALVSSERLNGYYNVKIPGLNKNGWIYMTLVRRYRDSDGDFVPYKRSLYRHWIDDDHDCQNTRAEVLIRDDDDGKVKFKREKECVVVSGTWYDPYTGKTFTESGQVDVDHVVPLKNAHLSGGWAWSKAKRREYANYMDDEQHLLAVSASENRRKGAKGPDKYMPPNADYHCDYVRLWLKIKTEWDMIVPDSEGEAIQKVLDNCPSE